MPGQHITVRGLLDRIEQQFCSVSFVQHYNHETGRISFTAHCTECKHQREFDDVADTKIASLIEAVIRYCRDCHDGCHHKRYAREKMKQLAGTHFEYGAIDEYTEHDWSSPIMHAIAKAVEPVPPPKPAVKTDTLTPKKRVIKV